MGIGILDKVLPRATTSSKFEYPTKCPEGHSQISWFLKDNDVYCWLCNKAYTISDCLKVNVDSRELENLKSANNINRGGQVTSESQAGCGGDVEVTVDETKN